MVPGSLISVHSIGEGGCSVDWSDRRCFIISYGFFFFFFKIERRSAILKLPAIPERDSGSTNLVGEDLFFLFLEAVAEQVYGCVCVSLYIHVNKIEVGSRRGELKEATAAAAFFPLSCPPSHSFPLVCLCLLSSLACRDLIGTVVVVKR